MKPLLVTMGDAAGIGPEIVCKAFVAGELAEVVVIGSAAVLRREQRCMVALIEHPDDLAQAGDARFGGHGGRVVVPGPERCALVHRKRRRDY